MKQIFVWLREQINDAHRNFRIGGSRFMYFVDAVDIINEAEAKWEAECCEWKRSPIELWTFDSSCGYYLEVQNSDDVRDFNFCPYCGKPIKISEVE